MEGNNKTIKSRIAFFLGNDIINALLEERPEIEKTQRFS